jgi:PIN domain nuclease of toxin-antitoxin system
LTWFQTALDSGIDLAPMTPTILVGSSFLPGPPLRDPADRIVAATARLLGYRLMTRDAPLLRLAEEGHMQAIAC